MFNLWAFDGVKDDKKKNEEDWFPQFTNKEKHGSVTTIGSIKNTEQKGSLINVLCDIFTLNYIVFKERRHSPFGIHWKG